MNKEWPGVFNLDGSFRIDVDSTDYTVDVYRLDSPDLTCPINFGAIIRGIPNHVMVTKFGAIARSIIFEGDLEDVAKMAPGSANKDTYPEPIGCPHDILMNRTNTEFSLIFFRK